MRTYVEKPDVWTEYWIHGRRILTDPPWTAGGRKTRNHQRRPDATVRHAPGKGTQVTPRSCPPSGGLQLQGQSSGQPANAGQSPHPRRRQSDVMSTASLDAGTCRRPASMVFGTKTTSGLEEIRQSCLRACIKSGGCSRNYTRRCRWVGGGYHVFN